MHRATRRYCGWRVGLGLAVLIAYGSGADRALRGLRDGRVVLCKPGPPLPFVKGLVAALRLAGAGAPLGVLMVPLLEHYASPASC